MRVEIYTSAFCGFCHRAKQLLQAKGVEYREISVETEPGAREAMVQRAGGARTVPQIFVDDRHLGGCDELYALEQNGSLDDILRG